MFEKRGFPNLSLRYFLLRKAAGVSVTVQSAQMCIIQELTIAASCASSSLGGWTRFGSRENHWKPIN
jgi:hypothetical protein